MRLALRPIEYRQYQRPQLKQCLMPNYCAKAGVSVVGENPHSG